MPTKVLQAPQIVRPCNGPAVCKYSNFCFVYYLHILDSSGCPGEKGQTFRKSKMSVWVHVTFFTRRFLYNFGCCGPWCVVPRTFNYFSRALEPGLTSKLMMWNQEFLKLLMKPWIFYILEKNSGVKLMWVMLERQRNLRTTSHVQKDTPE